MDYFEARYYSSVMGRFTSPDEFAGEPTELFADVAAHNPTFYADLSEPQSLNKYHYALNNPLRNVDPDGHQTTAADALKGAAENYKDYMVGQYKAVGNIVIGAINIGAEATGGERVQPFEAEGTMQRVTMRATEVVTVIGSLAGGSGPANVMAAETESTTAVAAEVGNAERAAESTQATREGIYEFPDARSGGKTYVGQSGNIPRRLQQHEKTGKLASGTSVKTTQVAGGKTAREIAEQRRINQLGGTRNVPGSRTSNIRNPVSHQRQKKLGVQ